MNFVIIAGVLTVKDYLMILNLLKQLKEYAPILRELIPEEDIKKLLEDGEIREDDILFGGDGAYYQDVIMEDYAVVNSVENVIKNLARHIYCHRSPDLDLCIYGVRLEPADPSLRKKFGYDAGWQSPKKEKNGGLCDLDDSGVPVQGLWEGYAEEEDEPRIIRKTIGYHICSDTEIFPEHGQEFVCQCCGKPFLKEDRIVWDMTKHVGRMYALCEECAENLDDYQLISMPMTEFWPYYTQLSDPYDDEMYNTGDWHDM